MTRGPLCRCCRCTHKAGTVHRLARGYHSSRVHTGRTGTLGEKKKNMEDNLQMTIEELNTVYFYGVTAHRCSLVCSYR